MNEYCHGETRRRGEDVEEFGRIQITPVDVGPNLHTLEPEIAAPFELPGGHPAVLHRQGSQAHEALRVGRNGLRQIVV